LTFVTESACSKTNSYTISYSIIYRITCSHSSLVFMVSSSLLLFVSIILFSSSSSASSITVNSSPSLNYDFLRFGPLFRLTCSVSSLVTISSCFIGEFKGSPYFLCLKYLNSFMNLTLNYCFTALRILILLLDSYMLILSTRYTKFYLITSFIHLLSRLPPAVYGFCCITCFFKG